VDAAGAGAAGKAGARRVARLPLADQIILKSDRASLRASILPGALVLLLVACGGTAPPPPKPALVNEPALTTIAASASPTRQATSLATAPATAVGAGTYTVQRGDTLSAIATTYGTTVQAIVAANPGLNPSVLQVGQQLVLPGSTQGAAAPITAGSPATSTPSAARTVSPPVSTAAVSICRSSRERATRRHGSLRRRHLQSGATPARRVQRP
jgi:LysM repeat protein